MVSALLAVIIAPSAWAAAPTCMSTFTSRSPTNWRLVKPAAIEDSARTGAVSMNGVAVDGNLVLSAVNGAFELRNSCIKGDLSAESIGFPGALDLTGTVIGGKARFGAATFGQVAAFVGATFDGDADFVNVEFRGAALFASAQFGGNVDFTDASFDRVADFNGAGLGGSAGLAGSASFVSTQFLNDARFTSANFGGAASFLDADFVHGVDLRGAHFWDKVDFSESAAGGDFDARDAQFDGDVRVTRVRFAAAADFTDAKFASPGVPPVTLHLEQANIQSLNLDAAAPPKEIIFTGGGVEELRMSPQAVALVRVAPPSGLGPGKSCADRACLYGLIEKEARLNGDLETANEAKILRLGLERRSWPLFFRQANWAVGWEIGGYLVRPSHPGVALLALFALGVLLRTLARRIGFLQRSPPSVTVAARRAWQAFRQFRAPDATRLFRLESALYKIVFAVLIINLEAVSPPIRNLVEKLI
jgi:pentapeptide repeat protein